MVATLNRSAIVVIPKQPLVDWLRAVDPTSHGLTLKELTHEPTIYLIPECDTRADVNEALGEVCAEISATGRVVQRPNYVAPGSWIRDFLPWVLFRTPFDGCRSL